MLAWRQCFLSFMILIVSTHSLAAGKSMSRGQWLFERLAAHPAFETTLYKDEALILTQGEKFYAAFAVVSSPKSPWLCAYAAPFEPSIGTQPGNYLLKPRYICNEWMELQAYAGLFELKIPPCGGQVCANPAIGVGNLLILPEYGLSLDNLPFVLPVKIDGRLRNSFDPSIPVAGDFN